MTEASTDLRELICFRVRDQEYGVDIIDVREIRGWTPATPLPKTLSFVRGVINLRGAVLPIVDMAARIGLGPSETSDRHVIIVVCIQGQLVGLLVDAVCDILPAPAHALQPTPELAGPDAQGFVEGLLSVEDRMIAVVRLDALMPPAEDRAA
ncbi:MAG: cheW [Phenylobacterium sp.]|jgi:purine-binding chemotaxis protein CheW|nr:cheW [Phenylobacterium sp.]